MLGKQRDADVDRTAGGRWTVLNGEPTRGAYENTFARFDCEHSRAFGDSSVVGKSAAEPVACTNLKAVSGITLWGFVGREQVEV